MRSSATMHFFNAPLTCRIENVGMLFCMCSPQNLVLKSPLALDAGNILLLTPSLKKQNNVLI